MTKLILGAITAVATLLYFLWKRYGSTNAELQKLYKESRQLREQMRAALLKGHHDKYHHLNNKRMLVNRKIRNLRR